MRALLPLIAFAVAGSAVFSTPAFAKEGDRSCGFVKRFDMDGAFLRVTLRLPKSGKTEVHVNQRIDTEVVLLARALGDTRVGVCLVKDEFNRSHVASVIAL